MADTSMTTDEREAFLADLHVGVLSVERSDGPPLAVPVWYRYTPGGAVELTTGGGSIKHRLLAAAGRASLCAQREDFPYAYVTVDGPVELTEATDEDRTAIAIRYFGEELGRAYAEDTTGDHVMARLTPERWFAVDYSGVLPG